MTKREKKLHNVILLQFVIMLGLVILLFRKWINKPSCLAQKISIW